MGLAEISCQKFSHPKHDVFASMTVTLKRMRTRWRVKAWMGTGTRSAKPAAPFQTAG